MAYNTEERRQLTSIVSYPERGEGGKNSYRGNCSPKLIEDLLAFYKPAQICDYMCGSGTTKAAADKLGVPCKIFDLHSGYDMLNMDIPERSCFTFWHPPYADIITYSDVMYSAAEVERKFGYDPRKSDLSRIGTWEDFVKAMNHCMLTQFSALDKGGRMAVLVGDIKKKGKLYSMIFELAKPGTLEQVIIKAQHNCVSDRRSYTGKFIPIEHEYLLIVRKDEPMLIPVQVTQTRTLDIRDSEHCTWRDVVAGVIAQCGGSATLATLYERIDGHRKAKSNPHWQEKIRQTLYINPGVFKAGGNGSWCLVA